MPVSLDLDVRPSDTNKTLRGRKNRSAAIFDNQRAIRRAAKVTSGIDNPKKVF